MGPEIPYTYLDVRPWYSGRVDHSKFFEVFRIYIEGKRFKKDSYTYISKSESKLFLTNVWLVYRSDSTYISYNCIYFMSTTVFLV